MISFDQIAFNLLLNSILSFMVGITVVYLSLKLFRIDTSHWKFFLLSLPFVKIIYDVFCGIPSTSYIFQGIDPLNLPPMHKSVSLGVGFSQYGPLFHLSFAVKDVGGNSHSISLADFLNSWLSHTFHPIVPKLIILFLLSASFFLLIRRLINYAKFEWDRRKNRKKADVESLNSFKSWGRKVDIYVSDHYTGTPFTGGILKPFICIPRKTHALLNPSEQDSVIKHELAHVDYLDIVVTLAIKVLGDIFWFVPGYRYLSHKIDRLREILADGIAVQKGASALHLASALSKLKECEIDLHHNVLYSAFFREKSLLKMRILRLLGKETIKRKPRLGWNNKYLRWLIASWTVGGVMIATFGGNREIRQMPEWLMNLLMKWGLM